MNTAQCCIWLVLCIELQSGRMKLVSAVPNTCLEVGVPVFDLEVIHAKKSLRLAFNAKNQSTVDYAACLHHSDFSGLSCAEVQWGQCDVHPQTVTSYGSGTSWLYQNLSDGYYCGKAAVAYINMDRNLPEICYYHTKTLLMTRPVEYESISHEVSNLPSKFPTSWILLIIAISSVSTFVCVLFVLRARKHAINQQIANRPPPASNQGAQSENVRHKAIDVGRIFMVYHKDNEYHVAAVQTLADMIETFLHCKVIVAENCKNEICEKGAPSWVTDMLRACNRIIFVSSEGAYKIIESRIKLRPNILTGAYNVESIFLYAWRCIHSNSFLCENYKMLFNVRFDYTESKYLTPNIVSGRHFQLPSDFIELLCQILDDPIMATDLRRQIATDSKMSSLYNKFISDISELSLDVFSSGNEDVCFLGPGV